MHERTVSTELGDVSHLYKPQSSEETDSSRLSPGVVNFPSFRQSRS